MSTLGQSRRIRTFATLLACPLRLSKRTICTPSQQVRLVPLAAVSDRSKEASLFDHLVGDARAPSAARSRLDDQSLSANRGTTRSRYDQNHVSLHTLAGLRYSKASTTHLDFGCRSWCFHETNCSFNSGCDFHFDRHRTGCRSNTVSFE